MVHKKSKAQPQRTPKKRKRKKRKKSGTRDLCVLLGKSASERNPTHPLLTRAGSFTLQGTWHTFKNDQSASFDSKVEEGLCAREPHGAHPKKKKTDRRIRRDPGGDANLEFVLVPAKQWPKPAKCTCCEDGVPLSSARKFEQEREIE